MQKTESVGKQRVQSVGEKRVQENSEYERTAEENRESSACLLTVAIRKLVMIKIPVNDKILGNDKNSDNDKIQGAETQKI